MSGSNAIKEKIDALNKEAFEIRNLETDKSISLSLKAQYLSQEINYPEGLATALNNEGFCYVQITNYELSLEKCFEALKIFSDINNAKGIALTRYNLGLAYQRLGDYTLSLDHVSKSMEYQQSVNDRFEMARCYLQLGFLYGWLHDNETSIEMYDQGLQMNRGISNQAGEAACLMGLGQTYLQMKEYDKCNDNLFNSMRIRKQIDDMRGYAAAMASYLTYCFETEKYNEGEALAKEGIKLATELGDKMGISRFMVDLGKIYLRQNKIEEAENALIEALDTAEKINLKMAMPASHFYLSEIYQQKGDYKKSLTHYQRFHECKEELYNTDAALKAKSVQLTGKIQNAEKEAEINRLKNVELKKAHDEIAEKNKDITDSINYAKRIQQALLASEGLLNKNLKAPLELRSQPAVVPKGGEPEQGGFAQDYFVLFKPKDIVSGDFYWAVEKNGCFYLAVCDSTGHGVPGAFMSLLNISFLNEAISEKNISLPNEVFNHARKRLVENISSDGAQDGMDGILLACKMKDGKRQIEYSAANNAPILIQDGKIIELDSDSMPVGLGEKKNSFTNHVLLPPSGGQGGHLYLYTDGFADQFGGPKGKKLKKKNLIALLDKVKGLPMDVQKQKLETNFNEWKGDLEQIDDVLIIGIKI